jgi:hypothetical protein
MGLPKKILAQWAPFLNQGFTVWASGALNFDEARIRYNQVNVAANLVCSPLPSISGLPDMGPDETTDSDQDTIDDGLEWDMDWQDWSEGVWSDFLDYTGNLETESGPIKDNFWNLTEAMLQHWQSVERPVLLDYSRFDLIQLKQVDGRGDTRISWNRNHFMHPIDSLEAFQFSLPPGFYEFTFSLDGEIRTLYFGVKNELQGSMAMADFLNSTVFPVPIVNGQYTISLDYPTEQTIEYTVHNLQGESFLREFLVITADKPVSKQYHVEDLPLGALIHRFAFPDGSYTYKLTVSQ